MVMEVMESLESSQVGDAREVVAAMVLPVVHEGEIVVSGVEPEDQKGGDPGRKHEPEQPPDGQRPGHDDEERRADECPGLCVVLCVTAPLKGHGIEPAPDRLSSWRTFLAAHWGTIALADFFTTDVWTRRGLVTYYSLFVIDQPPSTRRV
jgi:hypothetical protein